MIRKKSDILVLIKALKKAEIFVKKTNGKTRFLLIFVKNMYAFATTVLKI